MLSLKIPSGLVVGRVELVECIEVVANRSTIAPGRFIMLPTHGEFSSKGLLVLGTSVLPGIIEKDDAGFVGRGKSDLHNVRTAQ